MSPVAVSVRRRTRRFRRHVAASTPLAVSLPRGPVFAINFVRREAMPGHVRRRLAWLLLGYLFVSLGMMMALLGLGVHAHTHAKRLQASLLSQMPQTSHTLNTIQEDITALEQRAAKDLSRLTTGIALYQQRFLVSRKLAALATTLPPRTWVTKLSGDREDRTLQIYATYLIDPHNPYALPAKSWIEALKADARFGQHLQQLELVASSRKTKGDLELFSFELVAEWQSPGGGRKNP